MHVDVSRYTKRVIINKGLGMFITHTDYKILIHQTNSFKTVQNPSRSHITVPALK